MSLCCSHFLAMITGSWTTSFQSSSCQSLSRVGKVRVFGGTDDVDDVGSRSFLSCLALMASASSASEGNLRLFVGVESALGLADFGEEGAPFSISSSSLSGLVSMGGSLYKACSCVECWCCSCCCRIFCSLCACCEDKQYYKYIEKLV